MNQHVFLRSEQRNADTLFFYKNIQAEINQNFENTLRTYLGHTLAEGRLSASLFCSFFFFFLKSVIK